MLSQKIQNIKHMYSFISNPNKSKRLNFNSALIDTVKSKNERIQASITSSNRHLPLQMLQPQNLTVHNLCSDSQQPPPGTRNLLGLGLKFCHATPRANPDIKSCLKKLAYKIRTKQFLLDNPRHDHSTYIPQLYVKLKHWNPPPASNEVEDQLVHFEKKIKAAVARNASQKTPYSSLTPLQRSTLQELRESKDFIIMPTDKNLGPAIMNYESYVQQVLSEHLLTSSYQFLEPNTANQRLLHTKNLLTTAFYNNKHLLSTAEITYFERSFKNQHRTPIFYGMPKVHKTPLKLRPVVSCINSFNSIFSTWLDFRMKQLLPLIPSYIKDSRDLLKEIQTLHIPSDAKIFTADASAMYTNIDTNTGIKAFHDLFDRYAEEIPTDFPQGLFLHVLEIVMNNNVFSFGDTFWLQTDGTAMGTPAAPLYSIITYGVHENTVLLPRYGRNLLYYKRFIDDILGIWIDTPSKTWDQFKIDVNQFGKLQWNIEEPSVTTTFLDLRLTIQRNKIVTSTFQKPMNLYLYIPPLSAHPKSCFKGFITGEILRYWNQNSNEEDFISLTSQFIQRLLQRGHLLSNIVPIIRTAASSIDNRYVNGRYNNNSKIQNADSTLFISWEYHPNNIDKSTIHRIYQNTLQDHVELTDMKIAVSRPKNLRDLLCRTRLPNEVKQVTAILNHLQTNLQTHA